MAKYGKKGQKKVEKVMHEYKRGKLKSSSGQKVKDRKQAIAIGLSKAGKMGARVPKRKSRSAGDAKASRRGRTIFQQKNMSDLKIPTRSQRRTHLR